MREIRRVAPSGGGWDLTGKGGKGELWVMKTICIFLWVVVKQLYTIVTTFWTEYLKYEHFILCNKVDLTQQTKKKKKWLECLYIYTWTWTEIKIVLIDVRARSLTIRTDVWQLEPYHQEVHCLQSYHVTFSPLPPPHFFFFLHCKACSILVLWSGIEPRSLAVEAWNLNHWTTRGYICYLF